ncbi:MAG TPA: hypothetical protein VFX34_05615, partial [Sporosarcina sp.]|nr:hypothetical protein [Sporosarcina sp.]
MKHDILERQRDLATRKNECDRLQRRYTAKLAELKEAERLRDQLQRQLSKEQQDVVKLGKFS